MEAEGLLNIKITDSDIDEVEELLGGIKFDEQRRNILKYMDSVDIQANPGSGKTTVLVAKLAILAKKWPYANRGICVLSHTNAAREEIESRLGNSNIGKILLSYPHFIGTVHSFFDTFVGLPWLRSNNYPITLIDTETAEKRRYWKLKYGTRMYFEYNRLKYNRCESKTFPRISVDIHCKETSASYSDVCDVIDQSFRAGYFTFDELMRISEHALHEYQWLPSALQERFPIVFIDEAQDTGKSQWGLIRACFPGDGLSIRQSFGDANQAIYNSYGDNNIEANDIFPEGNYMTITNSHRFGGNIAKLADPLGVLTPRLNGELTDYERLDNRHTVFLFDDAKSVLPAYAEYLLTCFSDEEINGKYPCCAVGMVHKQDSEVTDTKKYPVSVMEYYPAYDPDALKLVYSPKVLIEFFRMGQNFFKQTGNYYSIVEKIASGIRKYLRLNTDIQVPSSTSAFNSLIKILPDDKKKLFRTDLFAIVMSQMDNTEAWNDVVSQTKTLMKNFFGVQRFVNSYFAWIDNAELPEPRKEGGKPQKNVFTYEKSDRTIHIYLSSIHAVKGKTHLATLVLDTNWYKRNIKSIMPWLYNKPPKKNPRIRDIDRLKCHYVALTRARGLICIAALRSSVTDKDKELLKAAGWNIVEIQQGE